MFIDSGRESELPETIYSIKQLFILYKHTLFIYNSLMHPKCPWVQHLQLANCATSSSE